ncbi:MAG: energy transducer TonB [Spirochaetes bacterium]|nr:energy transducer TonB [Spirochaetota bacterium]
MRTQLEQLHLPLVILISAMLHISLALCIVIAQSETVELLFPSTRADAMKGGPRRDVIVNINEDNIKAYARTTLLSEKDSSARGYITREMGDRWLNNSLEFVMRKGQRGQTQREDARHKQKRNEKILLSQLNEIVVFLTHYNVELFKRWGEGGSGDFTAIPDRNNITFHNAIFYSNEGHFSFNTRMYKNAKYFINMKKKIASNWFPPIIANAIIPGYAPGYVRIQAIQSQYVKLYFVMDREGNVLEVKIVDSLRHKALDDSCIDAIKLSKNFGPVPDDIPGEKIIIRFIFGYFVR